MSTFAHNSAPPAHNPIINTSIFVKRRTLIPNAVTNPKATSKSPNPGAAINRCERARANAYQAEFAISKSKAVASLTAAEAYRHAMPSLSNANNARDFISCVAHGLLIGVIDESKSAKLLYAARIASTSSGGSRSKQTRAPAKPKTVPVR